MTTVRPIWSEVVKAPLRRRLGRHEPWDVDYCYPPGSGTPRSPDFVGLGTQKSGTSWWFDLLDDHPDVDTSSLPAKELHYFTKVWAPEAPNRPPYAMLFAGTASGRLTGEWTPDYLARTWCLPELTSTCPDAALLVLLRDPLERAASGIAHMVAAGEALRPPVVADAVQRSCYGVQLARLLELADRRRVLVLQYERVVEDPVTWIRRTYEHVGLDPSYVPAGIRRVRNVTTYPKPRFSPQFLAAYGPTLRDDRQRLLELGFDIELDRWQQPW